MQPILEAHRGYSALYPENTLLAFRKAIAVGAASIELDVHVSADAELIVMHDATLDRTSTGQGPIAEHTLAELAKLDAGSWKNPAFAGEKIPTLQEALRLTLESNVTFNVEVKQFAGGLRDARHLTELLKRYAPKGARHVVSSFALEALLQVRQADPEIPLALLGSQAGSLLALAAEHHFPWIHCCYSGVHPDLVFAAHREGIKVMIWTLDQPQLYQHYARMGVDKICTNRIAEMQSV